MSSAVIIAISYKWSDCTVSSPEVCVSRLLSLIKPIESWMMNLSLKLKEIPCCLSWCSWVLMHFYMVSLFLVLCFNFCFRTSMFTLLCLIADGTSDPYSQRKISLPPNATEIGRERNGSNPKIAYIQVTVTTKRPILWFVFLLWLTS